MSWLYLALAIVFEIAGTTSMKLSAGLTRLLPSLLLIACYGISFTCLAFALKRIDVSVAYAIWSGVGTAAIAVIGFVWFREPLGTVKILSIGLIVAGVVGLHLGGRAPG